MCVCVLDHECFACILLRDVFESLTCCLDLWLSSLLDCIHLCVFPLFEKLLLSSLTASQQILDRFLFVEPIFLLSQQKLTHFRSIEISGVLPDSFLIHRETFCLADRSSTDSRSIDVGFCSIVARQLLDLSKTFLHVLSFTCFASFYYLVIHNNLFHYIHAFIQFPFAPLIIFMFLG